MTGDRSGEAEPQLPDLANSPRLARRMRWAGGAAIATRLLYVVLLGWHAKKHHSPGSGRCTGPYDPWQVVALAVALGLLVAFTAWKGHGW